MKVTTKHEKTDFGDVWHMSSVPKDIFRFAIYRYDDDKDTVYLSNVFVDNAHRKQGLGNSILNTADKVAKKLKANTICLKVKQDTFAHKWYGRHGYSDLSVDEEEPQFIWMTKNIGELRDKNTFNMKYKVGDKVRIKSLDWYNENRDKIGQVDYGCGCVYAYFAPSMVTFCGQIVTISSVQTSLEVYRIKEDCGTFKWTDEMIEGLAEEESEKKLSVESWKPSKEEMDVLYGLAYITNQYDEHKEEIITRLYQDLKREFFNGSSYENMFPDTEDDVRRRSTIQVLEYARSLDNYNQYGKEDIDKNIVWLEKQDKKPQGKSAPEAINERNIDSQNYLKPTNKVEPKFRAGESFNLPQGYQFVDENGNIINAQKIALEKKKKEYPKTYEGCAKELGYNQVIPKDHILGYMGTLLSNFQQLLICRDAYWKIAGEEMGLEKPWGTGDCKIVYGICREKGNIVKRDDYFGGTHTFEFPIREMRDAFYENFKELIENCKELM